jgi:ABC-type nitrate/sulfonate/bicarbonate transport system permease component
MFQSFRPSDNETAMDQKIAARSAAERDGETTDIGSSSGSQFSGMRAFLIMLPGLATALGWELGAWRWPSVARLVSQPTEIARGLVEVVANGTIWQHVQTTLTEMAVGYAIGAITGVILGFLFAGSSCSAIFSTPTSRCLTAFPKSRWRRCS